MYIEKIVKQGVDIELEDKHFDKVKGEPKFGSRIYIKWEGRTYLDKGYAFFLPESDEDPEIYDFLVHVPNPDNEDGMGDAPPEWNHIAYLLTNERVKWVKFTGGL